MAKEEKKVKKAKKLEKTVEKKTKKVAKPEKAEKTKKSSKTEKVEKAEKKLKKSAKADKVEKKTKKAAKPEKVKKAKKVKEPEVVVPVKEKLNASQLIQHLVDVTELDKKQVKAVVEALADTIKGSICKKGIGEFTFPKLFKVITKHVPAKKARKGVSPFSGEEVMFKAKPATTKVKLRAMKVLKEVAL